MKRKPVSDALALELDAVCQGNPWICDDGIAFEDGGLLESDYPFTFSMVESIDELKAFFAHGNWSIRTGIVFGDLYFVNQNNGGDEWWSVKRFPSGWLAFDSVTFEPMIARNNGDFESLIAAMQAATNEQCQKGTYCDLDFPLDDEIDDPLMEVDAPTPTIAETQGVNLARGNNPTFSEFVNRCFTRFLDHDWGDVPDEDRRENDTNPNYKFASYLFPASVRVSGQRKLWIIYDGTCTIALFPSEY